MMSAERILIVDDDRTTGKVVELQLNQMGYGTVRIARDGDEALECVETFSPDLVLMDINLGSGMDGIDTARTIQSTHSIPVIYMTAYSDEQTLERAKKTLPYGYINKPIRPNDLRTSITFAVQRARENTGNGAGENAPAEGIWTTELACDTTGHVIELDEHAAAEINRRGFTSVKDLLPPEHKQHITECFRGNRSQLVTGRIGDRVFSWNYRVAGEKTVRITVADVTEHSQLMSQHVQQASLSEALDRLATGVILVNENLKVFYTNKSARRITKANRELRLKDEHLSCSTPDRTAELQRLILQRAAHTLTLERGSRAAPLHLLVSPLHARNQNYGLNLPIAVVYLFEAATDSERIEDVIRSLYGLSPQEARITAKLVLRPELDAAAKAMGITYNTARTHLKRVYAKTNTNRLSSLVHMIVTGPVGLLLQSSE